MASRPTKYQHVVGNLPKLNTIEPERRDLVNAVKTEIRTPSSPDEQADFNRSAQLHSSLKQMDASVNTLLAIGKRLAADKAHAAGFAAGYADVRVIKDAIDSWASSAQLLVDAYEGLMLEAYEAEGVSSIRLESGASVSTTSEPYGQVVDKEAFRLWCMAPADACMACGEREEAPCHGDPIGVDPNVHQYHPGGGFERQLQLWPSSMNTLAKERTLAGEAPPDGVEVFAKTIVRRLNKA